MSLIKFSQKLSQLGCLTNIKKDIIELDIDQMQYTITIDNDWLKSIRSYYRARQYHFDETTKALTANKFVEYQVIKLDPGFIYKPEHKFTDSQGNKVFLSVASHEFLLSIYESKSYSESFHLIKERLKKRYDFRTKRLKNPSDKRINLRIEDLFSLIHTGKYYPKRKLQREKLTEIGLRRIKSCLFNLVYSKNEAWEVRNEIKSKGFYFQRQNYEEIELDIPTSDYETNLVTYYKVAKSSIFPGQIFLSYYHVLEYYFLRVADEDLFQTVRSQLNDPAFKTTYSNVTKLLSAIKRNDNTGDEQKMLRAVLQKYVPEEEYISFIYEFEAEYKEKIFSGKQINIFGETFTVKLEKGHALSNTAALLKHIRNSLVHSSDRYSREECYLPFSESEEIIFKYIPIIQYMAEKVIFATAT